MSAKARKLGESSRELGALADAARSAADRAGSAIDDAIAFVAASNMRIAHLETKATKPPVRSLSEGECW